MNNPKKPKRNNYESQLQIQCVQYFRLQYRNYKIIAIPNGGYRDRRTAKTLVEEGVESGVADLFVIKPNKEYAGLWIEMKWGSNGQSENQKKFQIYVERMGYKYVVAYTFDEFKNEVDNYLKN